MLRLGVLPEGYISPKAARAGRDLLRKRAHLVRQHTAHGLRVQNILVRNPGARLSGQRRRTLTKSALEGLLPEADQGLAVTSSFTVVLTDQTAGVTLGTQTVAGLAAGAASTLSFNWNTTAAALGGHTLVATHSLTDANPGNNQGSGVVTVVAPLTALPQAAAAVAAGAPELALPSAVATALAGLAYERTGSYTPAFIGLVVIGLTGAVVALALRPPRRRVMPAADVATASAAGS